MRAQCVVVKVVQGPMIHEEYSIAYRFTSMRHLCCQVHTSLARFPQIRNNDTRQRTSACMSACLTLCTLDVSRLGTRDSGGVRRRPYRTGPTAACALSLLRGDFRAAWRSRTGVRVQPRATHTQSTYNGAMTDKGAHRTKQHNIPNPSFFWLHELTTTRYHELTRPTRLTTHKYLRLTLFCRDARAREYEASERYN